MIDSTITGGPAAGLDPAYAYDTISIGVLDNVYEGLVTYNGTSTTTYSPVLSTCVPGGAGLTGCLDEYSSLAGSDGFTGIYTQSGAPYTGSNGNPTYWSFPIDPHAQFWDPSTGAHWGVYPTDAQFSQERNLAFANLPYSEATAGWILAQALLPGVASTCGTTVASCDVGNDANPYWDGGIHYPFNNTPGNILGSMLINATAFCPTAIQAVSHGCITYVANGSSTFWPNFLDFAIFEGGIVEPCSWYEETGAGAANAWAPGFNGTSGGEGGSCSLPVIDGLGGGTTTTGGTWDTLLSTLNSTAPGSYNATSWDSFDELAVSGYSNHDPEGNVNHEAVGSGPYGLVDGNMTLSEGFDLEANPYYVAPSGCGSVAGSGCFPATDGGASACLTGTINNYDLSTAASCAYIPFVDNTFVAGNPTTDAATQAAFQEGDLDFGGFTTTDTFMITDGVSAGYLKYTEIPTIDNFFIDYDLAWNATSWGEFSLGPAPNVPSGFLDNIAVRNFLSYTFPYGTAFSSLYKVDGITFQFPAGGPLPLGMGCYYPTSYDAYFPGAPDPGTVGNNGCTPTGTGSATNPSEYGTNVQTKAKGTSASPDPNGWYYWWNAATNNANTTGDYDSYFSSHCTTTAPCTIVLIGENGATDLNSAEQAWATAISADSGGRLKASFISVSFTTLLELPYEAANPQLVSNLGWAPDYPLPLDYLNPEESPTGLFTALDNVPAVLEENQYETSTGPDACPNTASNFGDLLYWSENTIPNDCQGSVYSMAWNESVAASLVSNINTQTTYYHEAAAIYNNLSLYAWQGDADEVFVSAPWINLNSLTNNPMFAGSGDILFFEVGYQATTTVNFIASGSGFTTDTPATWSVQAPGYAIGGAINTANVGETPNGQTCPSEPVGTCVSLQLPQGSDGFTAAVTAQHGSWYEYVSATVGGKATKSPLTVGTKELNVTLNFGAAGNASITEEGLGTSIYNSAGWSLTLTAPGLATFSGSVSGSALGSESTITSTSGLAPGTWTYTITYPSGFGVCTKSTVAGCSAYTTGDLTKVTGTLVVTSGTTVSKTIVFATATTNVIFKESGLPTGTLWGVFLNSTTNPGPTNFSLISGTDQQTLTDGSYSYLSSSNATLGEYNYTTLTIGANSSENSPTQNAALYANNSLACQLIGASMSGVNGALVPNADTFCLIAGTYFVQYSSTTEVEFTGVAQGSTIYSYMISLPSGFVGSPTYGFVEIGTKGVTVSVVVVDPKAMHVVLYAPEAASRSDLEEG